MRRALCAALALAALAGGAGAAGAAARGSILAYPLVSGGTAPDLVLAQRTITREWGPSEDSTYITIDLPGWKSEGGAALLSAVVPGAGQYYVGAGSWIWFALAEVAGWTAYLVYDDRGDDKTAAAMGFAGDPRDTASTWSFERWQRATGGDPAALEVLYAQDPKSFYYVIGANPALLEGWSGDPGATRDVFTGMEDDAQAQYHRAHQAGVVLWLNHIVAAADAFRAARIHNMPLQRNLELKLRSSWRGGRPGLVASLERRF